MSADTLKQREAAAILAREDLYFYLRWMFYRRKGFKWRRGRHHQIMCDALMRVFTGECKRLIINIPPRYSKTETVNGFVSWGLGHSPDAEFILTSYAAQLSTNNSWQIRETVQHEAYGEIFPRVALRHDSAAKHEWRTTAGGIVYSAGAQGTITGYGAGKDRPGFGGAIIIDDPHKADEARSDVIRQGVIDWFQTTLESRKNSRETPIILIMQRLHEADLAGWLIGGGNGEKWDVVKLPALDEQGEALWPEKHTAEELRRMREAAPYMFAGQYGQEPAPPEGNIFKPDKIEIVDGVPAGTRFIRGWDFAATVPEPGKDPDWTVGGKLGVTPSGRFIIADVVRMRGGPDDVRETLKNTADRDGAGVRVRIPQDPGQAGKAQVSDLVKLLAGKTVTALPVTGDKITRAEPFASQVNVGNVMMVKAEWNDALVSEMRVFPNGTHDDQIDALSDAFGELNVNSFGLLDFIAAQAKAAAEVREQENLKQGATT